MALLPPLERRLAALGEPLALARRRRRLSAKLTAERAGMTVVTLRKVERGDMGVTLGAVTAVLRVLGLEGDLDALAGDDPVGRALQDAALTPRPRSASVRRTQR